MSSSSARSRAPWLTWIAWLVLAAGAIVGGLALAAPMGVWVGAWQFGRGFELLSIANGHGDLIAIAGLIATIGLFVASRLLGTGNGLRLSGIALIGTIAAALAYYIPESFRPPEGANVPPIHDISTDTVNPPQYVDVLPLRADAPNTVVYGGSEDMTAERLAQLTTEAYPDVTTLRLDVPPDVAFERALATVEALGWDLVAAVPEDGRIEATDTTFWFRFKDDIVIRITPTAQGSAIDARSVSRVGRGDVGTNAKRLRTFLASLEPPQ
jgi:uncharacterized protein (DUF1499 family)